GVRSSHTTAPKRADTLRLTGSQQKRKTILKIVSVWSVGDAGVLHPRAKAPGLSTPAPHFCKSVRFRYLQGYRSTGSVAPSGCRPNRLSPEPGCRPALLLIHARCGRTREV